MKGLLIFKPILIGIIEHATPDELGQFLTLSRSVNKFCNGFENVMRYLKQAIFIVKTGFSPLKVVQYYQTETICIEANYETNL